MYLSSWKRTSVFELIPSLNKDKTFYLKNFIEHPQLIDFWNFFIHFKKVRYLTKMLKDNPQKNFISLEGDNILEVSLNLQYLPFLKESLKHSDIKMFQSKNNENLSVIDRIWDKNIKFSIYKEFLLHIRKNQLDFLFHQEHMFSLVESDVNKMIFFEKTFPGLFLILYPYKIDALNPHFQHVLLKNDVLYTKLKRKLKSKNDKKVFLKI